MKGYCFVNLVDVLLFISREKTTVDTLHQHNFLKREDASSKHNNTDRAGSNLRSMVDYGLLKNIASLSEPNGYYFGELVCMVVSAKIGTPSRLGVTDFTANRLIETDYTRENYIRNYDERIPLDQIIQLGIYENKLLPFVNSYKTLRGKELRIGEGWTNVLSEAVYVKVQVKFKMFNGVLEGLVKSMTLLDLTIANVDLSLPVFRHTIKTLPPSFVFGNLQNFEKTIPPTSIRNYITGPDSGITEEDLGSSPASKSGAQNARNNRESLYDLAAPYAGDAPTSPSAPPVKLSSVADLPEDTIHGRDYDIESPIRQDPQTQVPHTQIKSTYQDPKEKEESNFIERWNKQKTIDGKVLEFSGAVVEIEPLMNQLCIKYDINKPPVLNPITITVKSGSIRKSRNEDQFLRISFVSNLEVFNFLEMHELELIYIKSPEIYQKFQKILKSKNMFDFKVSRRLIKVNNFGNFIYGWEGPGMTLNELYKQA